MTFPCNFPGRVNKRRIGALARLQQDPRKVILDERAALEKRIVEQSYAVGLRTKKDHSSMAKFSRNA